MITNLVEPKSVAKVGDLYHDGLILQIHQTKTIDHIAIGARYALEFWRNRIG